MSVFNCFANLLVELRRLIWAEAVCLGNKNRVLILEHQCKRILATHRLLRALRVFGATKESQQVALEYYPFSFAFRVNKILPGRPQRPVNNTAPNDGIVPRREVEPPSQRVIHVSFKRDISSWD